MSLGETEILFSFYFFTEIRSVLLSSPGLNEFLVLVTGQYSGKKKNKKKTKQIKQTDASCMMGSHQADESDSLLPFFFFLSAALSIVGIK